MDRRVLMMLCGVLGAVGVGALLSPLAREPESTSSRDGAEGRIAELEADNARLRDALDAAQGDRAMVEPPPPANPDAPELEPAPDAGPRARPGKPRAPQGLLRKEDIEFVRNGFVRGPSVDIPKGLEGTPEMWIEAIRIGLESSRPGLVQHAQYALQALGKQGADSLARAFSDERQSDAFRAHILGALTLADRTRAATVASAWLAIDREAGQLRTAVLQHLAASRPTSMPGGVRRLLDDVDAPKADQSNALRIQMSADPSASLAQLHAMLYGRDPAEQSLAQQLLQGAQDPVFRDLILEVVREAGPGQRKRYVNALAAMKGPGWGRVQMTGEPDTFGGGDQRTAWASKKGEEGIVTVELDFPAAVRPERVRVHETFNPGAIIRVEGRGPGPDWMLLWAGEPQAASAPRWFAPALAEIDSRISSLRLTLDTNAVKGWNEIDAVQLVGDGQAQYASEARATSCYAGDTGH